jgi:hypothetical protein
VQPARLTRSPSTLYTCCSTSELFRFVRRCSRNPSSVASTCGNASVVAVAETLEEGVPEIAVGKTHLLDASQQPEPAAVPELPPPRSSPSTNSTSALLLCHYCYENQGQNWTLS